MIRIVLGPALINPRFPEQLKSTAIAGFFTGDSAWNCQSNFCPGTLWSAKAPRDFKIGKIQEGCVTRLHESGRWEILELLIGTAHAIIAADFTTSSIARSKFTSCLTHVRCFKLLAFGPVGGRRPCRKRNLPSRKILSVKARLANHVLPLDAEMFRSREQTRVIRIDHAEPRLSGRSQMHGIGRAQKHRRWQLLIDLCDSHEHFLIWREPMEGSRLAMCPYLAEERSVSNGADRPFAQLAMECCHHFGLPVGRTRHMVCCC